MKDRFKAKKIKDKKLLRKVKKNWVVVSLSVFSAFSFGGFITSNTITHADTIADNVHNSTEADALTSSNDSSTASSSASSSAKSDSDISATSSSTSSSDKSSPNSSATSSSTDLSDKSSSNSSATSSSTDYSAKSDSNNSATSSGKNYAYSASVIDSTQTTDSYSANDGTNIQNINDFDAALAAGDANTRYLKDAPNWGSTIDPMGAAWSPLISKYIKNGNYIVIPQDNINNAENLFRDYVNNYNLSDNYSNFEGSHYNPFYGSDYSIQGVADEPIVQDETGLKNVNPHKNPDSDMYEPTDKLQLSHIVVQTDFGDAGNDNGSNIQAPNSDNQVYVNHQSLEPYAGHYEAPIYQIVMKDLSNQVATYPANFIDSNASSDDERQATAAIPLDYMIFLHPQVYDKNGNIVVNDLSQSPVLNINYVYNDSQIVGSQKIFTDNQSSIDENALAVPNGYTLSNPNNSINVSEGQDSLDVPVNKISSDSNATIPNQPASHTLTSGSGASTLTSGSGSTTLTNGSGETILTSGSGSNNTISTAINFSSATSYSYNPSSTTSISSSSSNATSYASSSSSSTSTNSSDKSTASSANNSATHKLHTHHKHNHASMINKRIYNINTIYSYRKPTFTAKGRKEKFKRTNRTNRSMFKVVGVTKSHNDKKRYKAIKINPKTNRVMKNTKANIGYVTDNKHFVRSLYYSKVKNNQKFRAIRNLYEYRHHNLTSKVKLVRKGEKLTAKIINKDGTIYHLKLNNGRYVTANKRYVILNKYYK